MKESKIRKIRTYVRVVIAVAFIGMIISIIIPLSTFIIKVCILLVGILQIIDIIISMVFLKELVVSEDYGFEYVIKSPLRYIPGSLIIVTILIILVLLLFI